MAIPAAFSARRCPVVIPATMEGHRPAAVIRQLARPSTSLRVSLGDEDAFEAAYVRWHSQQDRRSRDGRAVTSEVASPRGSRYADRDPRSPDRQWSR